MKQRKVRILNTKVDQNVGVILGIILAVALIMGFLVIFESLSQ